MMFENAPIYFAIESENVKALQALLEENILSVNNEYKGFTPLLLAVKKFDHIEDDRGHNFKVYSDMIQMLLKKGSNVNAADPAGITPLILAAKLGKKEVINLMLDYADNPINLDACCDNSGKTARDYLTETLPNDFKSEFYPKNEPIEIQKLKKLFSYLSSSDERNFISYYEKLINEKVQSISTEENMWRMLRVATEKGLEGAVEMLTKSARPNIAYINGLNKEPLVALACRHGYNNILKLFIKTGRFRYYESENKESLIQITIKGMKLYSNDPKAKFAECVNTLLSNPKIQPPIDVNKLDSKKNTALHYAIRMGDQNIVLDLLRNGAFVVFKNKFKEPLAYIDPETLRTYFDEFITKSGRVSGNDYQIRFTYDFLINPKKSDDVQIFPEMQALAYMAQNEQLRPLLKHPVINSFICLKWQQIYRIFIVNLSIYAIFWLNLMIHILLENLNEDLKVLNVITHSVASIGLVLLALRELFQIKLLTSRSYFSKSKNWLELVLILITGLYLFDNSSEQATRHQLSAVAILLSSAELFLTIGQFPHLSIYIAILRTVSINFFKLILWYSILIIAFALSFYVLFKNSDNKGDKNPSNSIDSVEDDFFVDPGLALLKTIVMLTGEFDAGSIKFRTYPITSHFIFIIFVFMIPIVLMNLLSSLAVSDTQDIIAKAELVVLQTTVQSISYIEKLFIGNLYTSFGLSKWVGWKNLPKFVNNLERFERNTLWTFAKKITLFPNVLPLYSIDVKPNSGNLIIISREEVAIRKDEDSFDDVETGKCRFKMCRSYSLDEKIVKEAKIILNKKSQKIDRKSSELQIKSILLQILQEMESR